MFWKKKESAHIKVVEVKKLEVGHDDILVFTYPGSLSQEAYYRLKEQLHKELPKTLNKALLLEDGLDISTISQKVITLGKEKIKKEIDEL